MSEQIDTTPTTRMAWGAGFTTTAEDGTAGIEGSIVEEV